MAANSTNSAKERAFMTAQAHSRRVQRVKRILPIFAFGLVVAVAVTVFLSRPSANLAFDLPSTTLSDGKLVMSNPNLDGFTKDQRPYRVTAVRATQDLAIQDALQLDEISAAVELEDGQSARLTSSIGTFNNGSSMLILPQPTQLTTSDGMQAFLGQANINIQTGSVLASKSVKIINTESVITAKAMQIEDGGKRILFEDNVRFVLKPNRDSSVSKGTQTSQTVGTVRETDLN